MTDDLRVEIDGRSLPELHERTDNLIESFKYVSPSVLDKPKGAFVRLGCGEIMKGSVQVVRREGGGESGLHYHTTSETFWYILKGSAKFYGNGGELIGEFHAGEGIVTPRYSRYRYESGGDGDLELLQVMASDCRGGKSGRVDVG